MPELPSASEVPGPHRRYPVRVEEDVGALRRGVAAQAARLAGLPAGDAELVATELATNILRHTTGGHVLARTAGEGIELIAVDHGPGIPPAVLATLAAPVADVAGAPPERSGPQVLPGLGMGLAGVRRRAHTFDAYSDRRGAVILARLAPARQTADPMGTSGSWRWAGINTPLGDCGESGDAWAVTAGRKSGRLAALVVDGLGHGPRAADAARAAITAFSRATALTRPDDPRGPEEPIAAFIPHVHAGMRGTRGGVLALSLIDSRQGRLLHTAVGNIAGRILTGPRARLISHPGTLGTHEAAPKTRLTTYPWEPGATLVLASDGIDTHWDMSGHPELLNHHPAVIAAAVHRDHSRGTDDATVLVVRDTRDHEQTGGRHE